MPALARIGFVWRAGIGAVVLGAATAAAAADSLDTLDQRVWLRLGAFRPDIDTTARIDEAGGTALGTQFSFEDLGLPRKKTLPTLLVGARLGSAWRAEFEYFQLRRDGRATLDETLTVDDTTYPVAAELDTRLLSDVYRLSAGWSFVRTPQIEFGAVLGLHVTRFDLRLQGTVSAPGQPVTTATEQERQTVPLPTIGLYGAFAIAPGWQATARADYFSLKHADVDGRLINAQANLIYRATPNLGIGLGWRYDDYRVDSTKSAFRGRVEYRFQGPQAFLEAAY
jgi:hypothetical protein